MSESDEKDTYQIREEVANNEINQDGSTETDNNDTDSSLIEKLEYEKNPSLITRYFYAQRYIERQQDEQLQRAKTTSFDKWFLSKMLPTMNIPSLKASSNDYPSWNNSNLALRTTHWITCAGLLTSEIMGAYLVPNCLALVGYVPSNVFLVFCFFITLASGAAIWWIFLMLDSPEYPIKTFADIGYALFGEWGRQSIIFLQVVSLILTCATSLIATGEAVIILRDERVCWAGILLLLAGVTWLLCQIKQLNHLGKICVLVAFANYVNVFTQLGYVGEPNWANAEKISGLSKGPIMTFNFTPGVDLFIKVVAMTNISFVFAGSLAFPEVLSEMRRPVDFWKTLLTTETFILITYLIYGNYYYSKQGQYTLSPAVFGLSNTNALKGLSFISFVTAMFQGLFFGHVCCKIAYKNYFPMIIPKLKFHSKLGYALWTLTVTIVFICIFVISAGVPQVSAISAFTSSLSVIPLTFVFPFSLHLWCLYHTHNIRFISDYDPKSQSTSTPPPSVATFLKRGFKKYPLLTIFYICFILASLAFSGMGLWSSVEYIQLLFDTTAATSFTCSSPI
ncbi:unnamed protein product [Ambrosiozyma monospora]|uniref:Unnamed protein product n=1 Tax=Ambrosiozyma monospora TaxID=43982 RepID=A0ACB5T671_AMBMO|nr:unnamed protein product [Ambrosiozyma monospora]